MAFFGRRSGMLPASVGFDPSSSIVWRHTLAAFQLRFPSHFGEPPHPMRPLRALAAFLFLIAGVVLGALNPTPVMVDLGLVHLRAGLGVILLCALLVGVLVCGLAMTASVVLPLRRELRRRRKTEPERGQTDASTPDFSSPEP